MQRVRRKRKKNGIERKMSTEEGDGKKELERRKERIGWKGEGASEIARKGREEWGESRKEG